MRLGIADHLGWAVAVTASADHKVVDRRWIELVEPGVTAAPIHYESRHLDVAATTALVAKVRASVVRATSASLDDIDNVRRIVSISLRAVPPDFPDDIVVQRRAPYEARADAIMYRRVLSELAHARGWEVHLFDAKSARTGGEHACRAGRRGPAGASGRSGPTLDEGPSDGTRLDDRRRLKVIRCRRRDLNSDTIPEPAASSVRRSCTAAASGSPARNCAPTS